MRIIFTLVCATLSWNAFAQTPSAPPPPIKSFKLPNVAGDTISLDGYPSIPGIALIFTSNECAYDNYYTGRIKALIEMYSGKIQFLLINSSPDASESVDRMKAKYAVWGIHVPYLADKDQKALNLFEAKKSPEVFLLRNTSGQLVMVYKGALDDNPQVAADVKQSYLKTGIDRLLGGQQIEIPTIRAVGCSIRKK